MYVLGIETSCDETAAAVVKNGRAVLSNVVSSSLKEHSRFGGIIPEIASRRQMELINAVVQHALDQSQIPLNKINAIAVTQSPGLIGSLLVGISYARALNFASKIPLIEVDHVKAHIYANFLISNKAKTKSEPVAQLPAVGLVVSGGHTNLYYLKDFKHLHLLGKTRDDAAGEAFDKVAKVLNLGYPGGPIIDRLSAQGTASKIHFNCAEMPGTFDFSFSGIKTAVLYYYRQHHKLKRFSPAEVAYSFQKSVVAILIKKCVLACLQKQVKTLLIGGGVAANSFLRRALKKAGEEYGVKVYYPPLPLCVDNAAMIAGYAYHSFV